ncbi:hypothetical protein C9J44_14575 [Photobacterium sp. GB-27]|nr:hypothetical protein C9J42_12090 [Photobacterium sp. GB-56]PSV31445.1 hypothetical protein C9J40_08330 [Photobacterium sp. GB-72]PSV34793.1 hypothetical protein C9J44_14575 [Photobacterium sp. GB-27]PSV45992.1 hypothetical protein C9J46_05650 [Photobacterium sp. GB-36]PSV52449.1 hypothetical protein C9J45_11160 [Photobacterium sp. GB-1]PSV54342.1 hypothetical protein C9J43_17440 [Photobacterium sp. GB-3]PSW74333.1 hypothetical protein C9J41_05505 [Photobacterium sp. GB-50]
MFFNTYKVTSQSVLSNEDKVNLINDIHELISRRFAGKGIKLIKDLSTEGHLKLRFEVNGEELLQLNVSNQLL